jgi:hypothetical protein
MAPRAESVRSSIRRDPAVLLPKGGGSEGAAPRALPPRAEAKTDVETEKRKRREN